MSVYIIRCKDKSITDCYIGSTTDMYNREKNHRNKWNDINYRSYKYKVYQFIRDNGGWDNWEMKKIFDVEDDTPLADWEQYYIDFMKPTLNEINANRSMLKQKKKEYLIKWRKDNPLKYIEQNKRSNIRLNCDVCGEEMNKKHLLRHKRRKHLGITDYKKDKKRCDICDKEISVSNMSKHRKRHN